MCFVVCDRPSSDFFEVLFSPKSWVPSHLWRSIIPLLYFSTLKQGCHFGLFKVLANKIIIETFCRGSFGDCRFWGHATFIFVSQTKSWLSCMSLSLITNCVCQYYLQFFRVRPLFKTFGKFWAFDFSNLAAQHWSLFLTSCHNML